jgi:hypothetical protein
VHSFVGRERQGAKEEPRGKEYSHQLWVQLFSFGGEGAAGAAGRETLLPSPIGNPRQSFRSPLRSATQGRENRRKHQAEAEKPLQARLATAGSPMPRQ